MVLSDSPGSVIHMYMPIIIYYSTSPNIFHHVYMGWVLLDVINVYWSLVKL